MQCLCMRQQSFTLLSVHQYSSEIAGAGSALTGLVECHRLAASEHVPLVQTPIFAECWTSCHRYRIGAAFSPAQAPDTRMST